MEAARAGERIDKQVYPSRVLPGHESGTYAGLQQHRRALSWGKRPASKGHIGVLPFIGYATSDKIKERQNGPAFARGEVWRSILLAFFFFSMKNNWRVTLWWPISILPDCGDQHPDLYVWWNSKIPHTHSPTAYIKTIKSKHLIQPNQPNLSCW